MIKYLVLTPEQYSQGYMHRVEWNIAKGADTIKRAYDLIGRLPDTYYGYLYVVYAPAYKPVCMRERLRMMARMGEED
jgi:hypothetical protein